jgi:hypothetical protein
MHGFNCEETFIFDYTFEELQRFDAGEGEKIPSLQQVFDLV